jgi:hypothetical protein
MATLNRDDITAALERIGQLASERGLAVDLILVGGAAMVLAYQTRLSTRDVDVVIMAPRGAESQVRQLAKQVAAERDWPEDWLNDAAKGYMVGLSLGEVLIAVPGLKAYAPSVAQLLAMKLSAWRDDLDVADARHLLQALAGDGRDHEALWKKVEPYLVPGDELTAQYAFQDLWEALYGDY